MEVIECDRCKKRIGEKREAKTTPVKVGKDEAKAICTECAEKMERFMAGEEDLRTLHEDEGTIHGVLGIAEVSAPDENEDILITMSARRGTNGRDGIKELQKLEKRIYSVCFKETRSVAALPDGGAF